MKQENSIQVLVVRDNEGELRPMAGIWKDNELGEGSSQDYLAKAKNDDTIVKATLIEGSVMFDELLNGWWVNGVFYSAPKPLFD